jgi:hypothetical protein
MIFSQNQYKPEQFDTKKYYCKNNYVLEIFKLSENELIFYGTEGGILRTYDGGITWQQNYTGLSDEDNIIKLIEHNNVIFGVTYSGKIISSTDRGDYWNIKKVSSNLTGITKIGNELYYATNRDSIYVSSDNGKNWNGFKTDFNFIQSFTSQNDKLIATTYNKIYILNKDASIYKELDYPIIHNKIYHKFDKLYLSGNDSIAILNSNHEFEKIKLVGIVNDFRIYPKDNKIYIFTYDRDENILPYMMLFEYNFETKTTNLLSENKSIFRYIQSDLLEFKTIDVEMINDVFFISNYYKTIFKVKTYKDWENISYSPRGSYISEKPNLKYITSTGIGRPFILYSDNMATTLNLINSSSYVREIIMHEGIIIDTIYPNTSSTHKIDEENSLVIFGDSGKLSENLSITNHNFIGHSDDGLKTINELNIRLVPPFQAAITPFKFIGIKNNNAYFTRAFLGNNILIDSTNNLRGRQYHLYLYKMNVRTFEVDTMFIFKDSLSKVDLYFEDNKIWAVGNNAINYKNIKLFYSEDNGENFELKQIFDVYNDSQFMFPTNSYIKKNNNNDLTIISDHQYIIIDENDYSFSNKKLDLRLSPIDYDFNKINFENIMFSRTEIIDGVEQDSIFITKIKFDDEELIFEDIYKYKWDGEFSPKFTTESNEVFFQKNGTNQFYIPIEPERLEYYKSVQKTETRNYLWTEPPYPQPTNGIVKVETYWDSGLPFTEKDIEIYDITGIKINTKNTLTVQKESIYKGDIIWDASNYKTGIYIMKITHGTETRVRKIMVVE